jgi:prevent-host-death family protein
MSDMSRVDWRELQDNTDELIRRVGAGEEFIITVDGRPAALLVGPSWQLDQSRADQP